MPETTTKPTRRLRRLQASPLWRVEIAEHEVPPRWTIPAQVVELGGPSADYARRSAIRRAHADAGVPPWRPCIRASWPHTRARPCT